MFGQEYRKSKITFEKFLSGMPAEDYIFQDIPYEEQIKRAARLLDEAEYVLVGAGAGTSAAAGVASGEEFFRNNFQEFIEKYHSPYMQDMYSAGFYPFPTEEAKWGYWSKHALLGCNDGKASDLYGQILNLVQNKMFFVLTTNVDEQFRAAGFPEDKIFATQGSYERIQCKKGCHPKTYHAVKMFRQMDQVRKECCVPSYMVPVCPVCGGPMEMNLRSDQYFVQDEAWYEAKERFENFLQGAMDSGKKVCLLELGTGFNTPMLIRFPFERLASKRDNIILLRLNKDEAIIPRKLRKRAIGINADMTRSIEDISTQLNGRV